MPVVTVHERHQKTGKDVTVKRYQPWLGVMEPHVEANDFLRNMRKSAIQSGDLKLQRAVTLFLPWMGEPDKKQKAKRPIHWPVDLAPELDHVCFALLEKFTWKKAGADRS